MKKFEYKVEVVETSIASNYEKLQEYLNKKGEEGWRFFDKMITMKPKVEGLTTFNHPGLESIFVCFFEREI